MYLILPMEGGTPVLVQPEGGTHYQDKGIPCHQLDKDWVPLSLPQLD